ncbi:MAG: protein kinase [Candidatus Aminicenantes bacterium]|nr:protein kinase [Candidatus Aminicenantes bacterium]NIM80823.1 protein kinase [Candidatus Aminicenantes bacterium]NIN20207.1 protein kinase [Candidatus Aminicenantes bacterium]NIN43986.1 protein kinase [Candidatus Aminicenantes bacterium]NIN86795.1 protein kinase [Candidatus Aminicenantes bacterium]
MKQLPQIPGYRIIRKLGQGGMADVYLGFQEKLAREVAIKVLDPLLLRDTQFAKRFVKEAQTAAQLVHPNIITIHDVGVVKDSEHHYYYIVMEFLAESLSERLKQGGPMPPEEALDIVKKIAGALDYAHKKGFIHRDIKPDNIMFRFDGSVVLVDFGIARAMDSTTQLTRTGMSIGTPHYMSPEQCKGEKIDGRSDIYSLGVELYEILTGDVPYKAESTAGIIIKHIQDPIPTLPEELSIYQPLIDKMMAKNRDTRIQSGAELIYFIDGLITARDFMPPKVVTKPEVAATRVDVEAEQESLATVPTPTPIPIPAPTVAEAVRDKDERKKWLLPGILAALLVILAGTIIVLVTRGPGEPVETHAEKKQPAVTKDESDIKKKTSQPMESVEDKEKEKPKETGKDTDTDASTTDTGKKEVKTQKIPEEVKSKIKTKTEQQKPISTRKKPARTVTLLDLPKEKLKMYKRRIWRLQIPVRKAGFQIHGHISVELNIDESGKVTVGSLDETLTVKPEWARNRALDIIRKRLNGISLPPPTDKQGEPVQFQWRVTYKVGKFMNKVILTKQ